MRIAGIIKNDVVNGKGTCVSLFTQGCPHHCSGCHNPESWDFEGGEENNNIKGDIVKALCANGIQRNFSILGGEPLCDRNIPDVFDIVQAIRLAYPNIKIFCWTGDTLENLRKQKNDKLKYILDNIDYLIDGPFVLEERDITLWLRGSRNQRVIDMKATNSSLLKKPVIIDSI